MKGVFSILQPTSLVTMKNLNECAVFCWVDGANSWEKIGVSESNSDSTGEHLGVYGRW